MPLQRTAREFVGILGFCWWRESWKFTSPRPLLFIGLSCSRARSSKYVRAYGLRHCLAGLRAFICVAAYVWLRRDMATAREAKHINCRLTPQKQHDLIPWRICKRLSYTSKFHSKAISTARKKGDEGKEKKKVGGKFLSLKKDLI